MPSVDIFVTRIASKGSPLTTRIRLRRISGLARPVTFILGSGFARPNSKRRLSRFIDRKRGWQRAPSLPPPPLRKNVVTITANNSA